MLMHSPDRPVLNWDFGDDRISAGSSWATVRCRGVSLLCARGAESMRELYRLLRVHVGAEPGGGPGAHRRSMIFGTVLSTDSTTARLSLHGFEAVLRADQFDDFYTWIATANGDNPAPADELARFETGVMGGRFSLAVRVEGGLSGVAVMGVERARALQQLLLALSASRCHNEAALAVAGMPFVETVDGDSRHCAFRAESGTISLFASHGSRFTCRLADEEPAMPSHLLGRSSLVRIARRIGEEISGGDRPGLAAQILDSARQKP